MSFLDVTHHQAHAHSDYLTYTLHYCGPGPPAAAVICLACFLDSLADPETLATRKAYVIRQLTDMLSIVHAFGAMGGSDYGSGGSVTAGVRDQVVLLRDIATQHASLVVSALVDLAIWCNDGALEESLHRLCATLCNVTAATCTGYDVGPNFLAEMFVHRCATVLEDIFAAELPQPQPQSQPLPYSHPSLRTQTHPGHCAAHVVPAPAPAPAPARGGPSPGPLLQLLVDLTRLPPQQAQTHRGDGNPTTVLLKDLTTSPVLLKRLLEALIVGNEIDCWRGRHTGGVKSLVLRLLLTAAQHQSVEAAELVAAVGQPLFERCVALLGRMASGGSAGPQHGDLRPLCLELLTALAEQGCLLEQTHGSVGVDLAASSQLAAQLVAGLKPCLLDSSHPALQCAACRLLGVIAGRSHPRLVQQIIQADLAEYLFEVLRTAAAAAAAAAAATAAIDHRAVAAAGVLRLPASQHQAAAAEAAGELIRLAVVALSYLAQEGPHFRCRLHFGVEVLSELCATAAASCDHGLAADLTNLLGMAVIRPYHSVEAGGGGGGGAGVAGLGLPGGPGRLPLVDIRRILTAIEPLFPRPSSTGVDGPLACGGNSSSSIPAAAAVLTAAGAEGPVRLSEAHAACCRSACEVLSNVCGWEGTPQHSAALQPPLLKAIGSALRGLTVTAADSLGFAPGGYLWAACQLAVDAATVMPSLAPASTDTAATCVDMSEHGTGPPLVLCARRLTAELLRMWEEWVMPTADRWYGEARELGIEMQQLLPVMSRALHAAVVPLTIALSGLRPLARPAADSGHPMLSPAEDPAIDAATTLASHLLASGWVQFSFEVLAAAAAVAEQEAEATAAAAAAGRIEALPGGVTYESSGGGDGGGLTGQPGRGTSGGGVAGEIRLQVWRLLMSTSGACCLGANGDEIGGAELTDAEELSAYDSMAALMSGFESVSHVLEFLATGGAQQVVASAGGSGHVLVAGSAMNCFLHLLRCTLAAGDMGWAVTGGAGLEWLLVALSHVLAEPVVQGYWPRTWWQCMHLYREVEGRMAVEQGPVALPQHLLPSLEHMMQQQHPAAPAALTAESKPPVAASRACGVAAPLSSVGLPMSIWVMQHADQLPSIIAAALPVWLGLDMASIPEEMGHQNHSDTARSWQQQISAIEDLSAAWPLQDVLEAAAGVAASNEATSVVARLLQRCAEAGVGTASWVHHDGRDAGSTGDSLLGVYDLQSGARLMIRLLQLLSTCLSIRPQLAVTALDAGLLVSTRRLLLDLASAAGQQGDPWATAGVTWVLLLQMQLLLTVAAIAGDVTVGSEGYTAIGDSTWSIKALSEICQQVGGAAVKVLLLAEHQPQQMAFQPSGCDAGVGADADADAMHGVRASSVSHSRAVVEGPGATNLRSMCFKAVAMGIVLDLSLGGHVPAAAVMAESETFQRAARLDVAKAVTNASGVNETCASALLFLAVSALYQCNSSNSSSSTDILSGLCGEEPSTTAHTIGQIITAARPPSPPSLLEELLLLATTATAQVVHILALNCIWLRLVLHPDELEGMLRAGANAGALAPAAVPAAVGQEALPARLSPTQRLELLSCTLSNAACDNLGSIRSPALLGLSILASFTCEDGATGMPLLQVLPWARTLLHQAVGRVCTAHSISSGAGGFGSECADSGQGLPLHMELLAALQGFPDLAFLCSLQGAVARAAEVSASAPEPQKPGHGAPGISGSGSTLSWIMDGLRAAASDNVLVQALLQPQHPASQPLANSCAAGLVRQGLLDPAMLGRARNAAAGRVWRLQQQQQQQEVDGTSAGNGFDGVVMLQHLLRLCSNVEPAAAAVEMSGPTCSPSVPLCCSDTFQSWVVPALLFVVMSQEWNCSYARGTCFAGSRDRDARLQHVLGKWLLKGPLSGTDNEVLLRCIDSQMRRI